MRLSLKELMLVVSFAAVGCAALWFPLAGMLLALQAVTGLLLLCLLVSAIVDRGRRQAFAVGFAVGAAFYGVVAWLDAGEREGFWSGSFGTERAVAALHEVVTTPQWVESTTQQVVPDAEVGAPPGTTSIRKRMPVLPLPVASPPIADDGAETTEPGVAFAAAAGELSREIAADPQITGSLVNVQTLGIKEESDPTYARLGSLSRQQLETLARSDPANFDALRAIVRGTAGSWNASRTRNVTYVLQQHPTLDHFRRVASCLWILALGYTGGQFARWMYGRRTQEIVEGTVRNVE